MPELLAAEFSFRGSRGAELKGHAAFREYVCEVRIALAHYRCEILEGVSEGPQALFSQTCQNFGLVIQCRDKPKASQP